MYTDTYIPTHKYSYLHVCIFICTYLGGENLERNIVKCRYIFPIGLQIMSLPSLYLLVFSKFL